MMASFIYALVYDNLLNAVASSIRKRPNLVFEIDKKYQVHLKMAKVL